MLQNVNNGVLTYEFTDRHHPLHGIKVRVVYPNIYQDSEIFYSRTGEDGTVTFCKLAQGTTRKGVVFPRNNIIRVAIASAVNDLVPDIKEWDVVQAYWFRHSWGEFGPQSNG